MVPQRYSLDLYVNMEGKEKAVLILTFIAGFIVGWKVKEYRMAYLKAKRDYLAGKARKAQAQIDDAASF